MEHDRINCSVFGCKRTSKRQKPYYEEIICRVHWASVPKKLRRGFSKSKRITKLNPTAKNIERHVRFWRRCIKAAENEQFGIGF